MIFFNPGASNSGWFPMRLCVFATFHAKTRRRKKKKIKRLCFRSLFFSKRNKTAERKSSNSNPFKKLRLFFNFNDWWELPECIYREMLRRDKRSSLQSQYRWRQKHLQRTGFKRVVNTSNRSLRIGEHRLQSHRDDVPKPIICRLRAGAAGAGCSLIRPACILIAAQKEKQQCQKFFINVGLIARLQLFVLPARMIGGKGIWTHNHRKNFCEGRFGTVVSKKARYTMQMLRQVIGFDEKMLNKSFSFRSWHDAWLRSPGDRGNSADNKESWWRFFLGVNHSLKENEKKVGGWQLAVGRKIRRSRITFTFHVSRSFHFFWFSGPAFLPAKSQTNFEHQRPDLKTRTVWKILFSLDTANSRRFTYRGKRGKRSWFD